MTMNLENTLALFEKDFFALLFDAHAVHRAHFNPQEIQISTLLSIKTGGCPEDCAYCPQSARYDAGIGRQALLPLEEVLSHAKLAKEKGASRFCMGAAWRSPKDQDLQKILQMVKEVKSLGLETCVTLGMLTEEQALSLAEAGLDFYNHNLDSDENYYEEIIHTRRYEDRLQTLNNLRKTDIKVCCGGIVGMGEDRKNRAGLLAVLASLNPQPESVPINLLVKVKGTPLYDAPPLDPFELVRTIAVARMLMPNSRVRLSAGRTDMSEELQALCFFAGANSIFYGETLLTTPNPAMDRDIQLLQKLDLKPV
jgi:biotin synthase